MRLLKKVNFVTLMIFVVGMIGIVVWLVAFGNKQSGTEYQLGTFGGVYLLLFVLDLLLFFVTYVILFGWTVWIYHTEKQLKTLVKEYLIMFTIMLLIGILVRLFVNSDMDARQFILQVVLMPWVFLWVRVRECVNTYSDDMVIRRK
jgi:FtsH-binding integral membrane protein